MSVECCIASQPASEKPNGLELDRSTAPAPLARHDVGSGAGGSFSQRFCMERGAGLVRIDAERPVIDQLDALFGTMVHR